MTSTYNLSRRANIDAPTAWESFQQHGGVCPPGYLTVPIRTGKPHPVSGDCPSACCDHDWKFCVPQKNADCNPITFAPENRSGNYEKRHFTTNLYNLPESLRGSEQSPALIESDLLSKDYLQETVRYDGTGFKPVRPHEYPIYAKQNAPVDEYEVTHLIQRSTVKARLVEQLMERAELCAQPADYIYRPVRNCPAYVLRM